ncbi:hypothetical protein PVAP13_1NG027800 [Panicum virgatum]|uniref:Uncharacterized protein n=1 Tax=Panicum virgatum TaxID=38727 RepID=A0A8T0WHX3_PANVG|nr:hypothetical protein PVAP13_1NG027800 [Panicum virgatum]
MQSASSGLCAACSPDAGWHAQRSGMPRLASSSLSTIRSRESFIFSLIHEKTLPSLAAPPPRSCSRVSVLCSCEVPCVRVFFVFLDVRSSPELQHGQPVPSPLRACPAGERGATREEGGPRIS